MSKLEDIYKRYAELESQVPKVYKAGELKTNLPARTFTTDELRNYITQSAQQASRSVPVSEARFQTPEQLGQTVQQITRMLEPYTKAQKEAAQYGYGQAMQNLANKWAARGLLASGGAMAQERAGAVDLARILSDIEAQQQATAIPYALQYGQLGLQESNQLFNQQMANLQQQQQVLADAIRNYLSGMSQEEAQRQFEQNYDLQRALYEYQRAQQQLDNMRNILAAQTDIAGQLAVLPMQEAQLTGRYEGQKTLAARQLESDTAYRDAQLKLATLDTTLRYIDQLGYPEKQRKDIADVVDYAQSGGAGMSLRNYATVKGGNVDYNAETQNVTVDIGGKKITFKAGQGDAYGIGATTDEKGNTVHYVADPDKLNSALGGS